MSSRMCAHIPASAHPRSMVSSTLAPGDTCLCLDYTHDSALRQHRHRPLDFLKLQSEEELWMLYCQGRAYAQVLLSEGLVAADVC